MDLKGKLYIKLVTDRKILTVEKSSGKTLEIE